MRGYTLKTNVGYHSWGIMATNDTGLLIYFDEIRRAELIKAVAGSEYESFSDALSVRDWDIQTINIALLSFNGFTFDFMALAEKGNRVVTSKSRVEFSRIIDLGMVSIVSIEKQLGLPISKHFIRSSSGIGSVISKNIWPRLIDAIRIERPQLANEIDRLIALLLYSGVQLGGEVAEVLLQERDALGISLDIFYGDNELRKNILGNWAPSPDDVNDTQNTPTLSLKPNHPPFLMGIPGYRLNEEMALQQDLFNWPDMESFHNAGSTVFTRGDRRLDVIYANRNSLEKTLGVDLIYWNQIYEMFVLVQYKIMRGEAGEAVYRPDDQLREELRRMDVFYELMGAKAPMQSHKDYRLSDDGFFIKLIPNKGLTPATGELIKGMYLHREYMNFLLKNGQGGGSQGGVRLTFDTAPRYMTNSQFIENVNAGWIGTRGIHSDKIKTLIREYYETGRAILFAKEVHTKNKNYEENQNDLFK
jgi:hypothetical protein